MFILFFFFKAEDGIRDYKVTGVQTCSSDLVGAQAQAVANWVHSPVYDDHRPHQLHLRFPHFRSPPLAVPRFHQRAAVPDRVVRGIPGYADAGSVCDPDGRQPFQEPAERAVADCGCGRLRGRRRPAVYAPGRCTWVHSITAVVTGCDFATDPDLSVPGASRQDMVLSPACVALTRGATFARSSAPACVAVFTRTVPRVLSHSWHYSQLRQNLASGKKS